MTDARELPAEFDVPVQWGETSLVVHMQESEDFRRRVRTLARPVAMRWWFGKAGPAHIRQAMRKDFRLMVIAELDYPDVIERVEQFEHRLCSDWCDNIPDAVAQLYAKVEEVRRWVDEVLTPKKEDAGP